MIETAWLIPLLPMGAFIIIIFILRPYRLLSAFTALAAMAGSLFLSSGLLYQTAVDSAVSMRTPVETAFVWLDVPGLVLEMGILIDPLTAVMLFVVTLVAFLVLLYSVGYMKEDPGFSRFFAYISLFTFSMLGLVASNNFFQTFVFWELVGLSSYLLIGFWFHKDSASEANKKAFITNRVADFGFYIGLLVLFFTFGTFNFIELSEAVAGFTNASLITVIALLIFIGPMGKSGQFPFHVWLPDAMEGPTPVSALIHAATMVAAGVYLLARAYFIFDGSPQALLAVAWIGGFTAFFAASIAVAQNDFKRILAYSTLSQLGFMVMAVGLGNITAAMFHLTTHAFFKALLFLGAGSVIHALNEKNNIWDMGSLWKKMPVTTVTFITGALALAGVFPLAGFWSKNEIMISAETALPGASGLWYLATVTAFLTAFYMFRLIFTAFFGPAKPENHPHESPPSMVIPLVVLGILSVVAGLAGSPLLSKGISHFIYHGEPYTPVFQWGMAVKSTAVAFAGIAAAWIIYHKKFISAEAVKNRFRPVYNLLYNKYYIDEFYQFCFDKILYNAGRLFNWSDRKVIDGVTDNSAELTGAAGEKVRKIQTGNMQNYALVIFIAVVVFVMLTAIVTAGGAK